MGTHELAAFRGGRVDIFHPIQMIQIIFGVPQ
jgi:hypothetical protein